MIARKRSRSRAVRRRRPSAGYRVVWLVVAMRPGQLRPSLANIVRGGIDGRRSLDIHATRQSARDKVHMIAGRWYWVGGKRLSFFRVLRAVVACTEAGAK